MPITTPVRCQARAMAREVFGDDELEPCLEEAEVLMDSGHQLCAGCVRALAVVQRVAVRLADADRGFGAEGVGL